MSYEKPELFELALAASAVRSGETKANTVKEAGTNDAHNSNSNDGGDSTSSTAGAYEADE